MTMKAKRKNSGGSISYTPVAAMAAGDVAVVGNNLVGVTLKPIPASTEGTLELEGQFTVVKDNGDWAKGDPVYWDADGNPYGGTAGTGCFTKTATGNPFAGWAAAAAGTTTGTCDIDLQARDSAVAPTRASLTEDALQPYPINWVHFRVWDAPQTTLPGTPANDDLGLIYNTFLTAQPSVESGDLKAAGATTRRATFFFEVPPEYVAGQDLQVRLDAGMKTTVADTAATIDLEVTRMAAPTVDICVTAAQSINNLTKALKTFTLTPTNVVPGDILECRVTMVITDAATGTAVIGKLYKAEVLADIKG